MTTTSPSVAAEEVTEDQRLTKQYRQLGNQLEEAKHKLRQAQSEVVMCPQSKNLPYEQCADCQQNKPGHIRTLADHQAACQREVNELQSQFEQARQHLSKVSKTTTTSS